MHMFIILLYFTYMYRYKKAYDINKADGYVIQKLAQLSLNHHSTPQIDLNSSTPQTGTKGLKKNEHFYR